MSRRVLVCGSRTYTDVEELTWLLDTLHLADAFSVVIEGEARGADTLARQWAEARGIPVEAYPADWERYGKAAGPIRNRQMLDEGHPDLVVAFPAGRLADTKGTLNMVSTAQARSIRVVVDESVSV